MNSRDIERWSIMQLVCFYLATQLPSSVQRGREREERAVVQRRELFACEQGSLLHQSDSNREVVRAGAHLWPVSRTAGNLWPN